MAKIKAYKGTDKDMQCLGYQFNLGETHSEKRASLCKKGFHACEYPLDVLGYYVPSEGRYFEADLDATDEKETGDSKRVGKSIKLTAEIGIPGLIKAAVEYIKERVDWKNAKESNTGYRSAATNTGYRSAATNTGNWSAATNTGDQSAATNTGNRSAATAEGEGSVAMVSGYGGKARGKKGCVLFLIERDENMSIIGHKSLMVDGKRYKEMVYYTLRDGKVVKAED